MTDSDEVRDELAELRDEHIAALEVLAEVAALLGRPDMRIEEVADAVRAVVRERDEAIDDGAMACEAPSPQCDCAGCSYARDKGGAQ